MMIDACEKQLQKLCAEILTGLEERRILDAADVTTAAGTKVVLWREEGAAGTRYPAELVRERMSATELIRYVHTDRCFVMTERGREWLERWRMSQNADSGFVCPGCGQPLEAKQIVIVLENVPLEANAFFACHNPDCLRVRVESDDALPAAE